MSSSGERRLRILLVDDDPECAESMGLILKLTGFETLVTCDGASALGAARSFCPEVCLLDLGVPEPDGRTIARRIREMNLTPRPLFLGMSGHHDEEHQRMAREAGIDHYLTKPVDPEDLRKLLTAAQDGRSQ